MAVKKTLKMPTSVDDLNSKYSGAGLSIDISHERKDMLWVPTSSPWVNYHMGGGFFYGRIAELAGEEASGKTLLALDAIAQAQLMGGMGIFIDAEHAYDKKWAEKNGVDPEKLHLFQDNVIEYIADFTMEAALYWRGQLTNNEPIVMVIDSLAALETKENIDKPMVDAKAEMGNRAKATYALLRKRNRHFAKLGITVIIVNQLRDTINTGFGSQFKEKKVTTGGKAMKFYATQRIFVEVKKQLTAGSKAKKHQYGVEVEFFMKKNKVAPPRLKRRIGITFDPDHGDLGFDYWGDLEEILIMDEVIDKDGNTYYFEGEQIASSKAGLRDELLENEDLREDIFDTIDIPTPQMMRDRLNDIEENRYPVTEDLIPKGKEKNDEEE